MEEHNRNEIAAIVEHRVVGDTDDNYVSNFKSENSHKEKGLGMCDYNIPFGGSQTRT